ncbi:RNA-binding protein RO60-like [Ruditapes philippinarum]|uniref:RNA-binding protein RO60-like n=1 Tax=Ruditapes philippinarum TaxID=129788 RepID=UPI00295A7C43|nr:RNA-binding protein RO60-like [Ruditapes philippinarum]
MAGIQEGNVVPQNERLFESRSNPQIPNNVGGFEYKLDDMKHLHRFLIIGSDRTHYAIRKELEIENKNTIKRLIRENNGAEVVKTIKEISKSRRNVRQDALLFAFAVCARSNDTSTKRAAYAALSDVCRIPTHLFMFINYCEEVSSEEPSDTTEEREAGTTGWGRAHKRAIQSWYTKFEQTPEILARLIRKYGKGDKWKHKDVIRLCHAKTDDNVMKFIFSYIIKGYQKSMTEFYQIILEASDEEKAKLENIRDLITVYDDASRCQNVQQLCHMIREHKLAWEHCNQTLIKNRDVWHNLLPHMPIEALVRNLSRMTKYGLLTENSEDEQMVLDKIRSINIPCDPNSSQELHGGPLSVDEEMEDEHPWGMGMSCKNYLHPLKLLTAWQAYKTGHSERRDSQWTPNQKVVDALEEAFYKAYSVIERTNKTFYLAVNTSVSTKTCMYDSSITHSMAAAAMLMLFARTEENCIIKSFGGERVEDLGILRTDKLEHVEQKIRNANHPRVNDCAQPIKDAIEMQNTNIDVFVYYTDSETCGGNVHPYEALIQYRKHSGNSEVRLVVCAMNATDLTLADQEDPLVLDIVGVDANTPWVISEFAKGHI